ESSTIFSGGILVQVLLSQAYQTSSGYRSPPRSTLNFVSTTSAAPQHNSDLGSAFRYGCASLSGRWRLSNHSLCGPSCVRPVVQNTRVLAVAKSADQVARAMTLCISSPAQWSEQRTISARLLATGVI